MSPLVGPHNAPGGIWKGEAWENDMQGGGLVHQWLLAGWGNYLPPFLISLLVCSAALMIPVPGVMIGEMWDLEELCEKAEELGRYTCFVSSVPLKVSLVFPPTRWRHTELSRDHQLTRRPSGARRRSQSTKCRCHFLERHWKGATALLVLRMRGLGIVFLAYSRSARRAAKMSYQYTVPRTTLCITTRIIRAIYRCWCCVGTKRLGLRNGVAWSPHGVLPRFLVCPWV